MSAAAAGEEGYGGGIGGKFRRRPFRRAPATPYDRPATAARGIRGRVAEAAGERSGWLSKLVDPASRLITRGATRFFSSVFQKRLGAPPAAAEAPVANHEPREDVPDLANTNPLPKIPELESKDDISLVNDSNNDGISELEQLLRQKTFTRAEFDHLTELLRSRTVDLPGEDAKKGIESGILLPSGNYKKKEVEIISGQENGIEMSKYIGTICTPGATLKFSEHEIASPAEVAKAYMDSRPPKMTLSSSLRSQTIREATASPSFIGFSSKPSAEPVSSKSVNRLSGVPGYSENGYLALRPRGRSAIYKMSRSPYFKGSSTVTIKGNELHEDGYSDPSTSNQLTPMNLALSGGKQALKRRSSVLESDIGSLGPIRRIRQKSNLASPSKDVTPLLPVKFFPPAASALDDVPTSRFSIQMPSLLHESKYDTPQRKAAENGGERIGCASVPPQSSEMARKILQQLDKLVPSPKEKSSEVKAISKHESPPKLTLDMLHGQALKSVAEIDSSKIFNVETNGKLDGLEYSLPGSSISPKQAKVEENGPSKPTTSEVKMAFEPKHVEHALVSIADTRLIKGSVDSVFPHSSAGPPQKKPAFMMQAPEDLLELEDDSSTSRDASGPSATGKEKIEAPAKEPTTFITETQVTKKPSPFSSDSKPASNLTLSKEAGKLDTDRHTVADEDTVFTFQVASPQSQPPLTPTMPSPPVQKSAPLSEQITVPSFSFSSKTTPVASSSSMTSSMEPPSQKFGAKSDSKGQLFGSLTTATETKAPVESESGRTDTSKKPEDLFKSVGTTRTSGLMAPATSNTFSFAASTTSSQSNGLLASTSSIFSASAATAVSLLGSSVGPIVSASSPAASTSGGVSIASSTPSSVTLFQFGSSSAISTDSLSPVVKSGPTNSGPEPVKESSFGFVSCAAATPSSIGTSIFGFGASSSSGASTTAGSIFGSQFTKSGSGTSLSSQSMMSQFASNSSPAFGLAGSSLGFGSSAFGSSTSSGKPFISSSGFGQSSTPSLAVADSSAPSSSSFAPSVTSPSLFGASSQSATSSIFGSVFGSSSSPSTMFTSAVSSTASATTSFGSASSSPLTFTSSAAVTSTPFIFSQATTASSPAPSFTSFGTTTSAAPVSAAVSAFGVPNPTVSFGSGLPANDQMNVEDSMADDTIPSAMPSIPTFGQPSNGAGTNLPFGSPGTPSGAPVFQFASPQASTFSQTPFQAAGSFEFGGGFSMGSGGGDKSGRRFIKAKRDKHRKK